MNDGTTDYKNHQSVESLAFGRCDYAYRNLGRPSKIQIKHTASGFEVLVDKKTCFRTDKVALPTGNTFGISAASAENPDSFEIFKFALSTPDEGSSSHRNYQAQYKPAAPRSNPVSYMGGTGNNADLSVLQNQINDLKSRLNALTSSTDRILTEIMSLSQRAEDKQQEIFRRVAARDQLSGMESRMQRIEKLVESVQKDIQGNKQQFNRLQDAVQRSHSGLLEHVQSTSNRKRYLFRSKVTTILTLVIVVLSSAPRMGLVIFFLVAVQMVLAGAYVWYKRRRANMPKKFL